MNVAVLNGSPKGDLSVTLQYVRFLARKFPAHDFEIMHIGQRIKRLERDSTVLADVLESVRGAELVLWATPVYYLLVPGQLKRFIELVDEHAGAEAFSGRYAAALTTSIHFFDHTAHNYLAGISEDLGMRFYGGYSAEMADLARPEGRGQFLRFADGLFAAVAQGAPVASRYAPVVPHGFTYTPGPTSVTSREEPALGPGRELKALIVADGLERSPNLAGMVNRLASSFDPPVQVVDLASVDIKAGCQGCLHCGLDNECQFEGKDEFTNLYREQVMTADLLFFAGDIRDRYLSARWKTFFDRSFFRGHVPTLNGKQVAWLVAGPLRQLPNLRQIMEGYTELHGGNLLGTVSDEYPEPAQIDALLDDLAARGVAWVASGYKRPATFLKVGGGKLFRDRIWSDMRLIFQADHRYYRAHGLYDFPQRRIGVRLLNVIAPLIRLPFVRRRFVPRIREGMVLPFRRVVESS